MWLNLWPLRPRDLGPMPKRPHRGFGHAALVVLAMLLLCLEKSVDHACFICNGPHLSRECPDRCHPGPYKGKGKFKHRYVTEYDQYTIDDFMIPPAPQISLSGRSLRLPGPPRQAGSLCGLRPAKPGRT